MCQCATTSVRWPTFVECFETAPLQYESWCTLCFWLMVWLKITRRSQKCFVCLFDGPAYRRTCLAGTVVLPDTRAALCVFHQTASRSQPIPIEWKNCIYIRMNSQYSSLLPVIFQTFTPNPDRCVLVPTFVDSGRDTVLNYPGNAMNSVN